MLHSAPNPTPRPVADPRVIRSETAHPGPRRRAGLLAGALLFALITPALTSCVAVDTVRGLPAATTPATSSASGSVSERPDSIVEVGTGQVLYSTGGLKPDGTVGLTLGGGTLMTERYPAVHFTDGAGNGW